MRRNAIRILVVLSTTVDGKAQLRVTRAFRAAVIATVVLTELVVGINESTAAFPGGNGKVAFAATKVVEGQLEQRIYVINGDGTGQAQLTTGTARADTSPEWSPDGAKIAFESWRGSGPNVYVMNADGSDEIALTNNFLSLDPTWSPDGTKIAFAHMDGPGNEMDIYVMNADGSGRAPLTTPDDFIDDGQPAWSPDGTKLAFTSFSGGDRDIHIINADGSGRTAVTTDGAQDTSPAFSPDGRKIAFERSDGSGNTGIWVVGPDGTGPVALTPEGSGSGQPAWSPDGSKIVFRRVYGPGSVDLYVMNADGTGESVLTTSGVLFMERPAWQPVVQDTDGDGIPDATDTDDDNDGLDDTLDPDPLDEDVDDDGIPDGQDVEWVQDAIRAVPASSIKSPAEGNRNAMLSILNDVEKLIAAGNETEATRKLENVLGRVDGCGTKADKNDWILNCSDQLHVRGLIEELISNLAT